MALTLSLSTVAPAGSFVASGRAAKNTLTRLYFRPPNTTVVGTQVGPEFKTDRSGKFKRTLKAPTTAGSIEVVLRQPLGTSGQWEQGDVKLLVVAGGSGGGTTPEPPNVPPTPPIANSGVSGSATGQTTATVQWTTSVAGTGYVEFGTSTAYGSQTASTSSGTSHSRNLTGLTPGQTYHYRVVSTDGTNTAIDQDRTFTTTAAATLPGAPTNLVATGANTAVSLAWNTPASNGGSAITGYRVYRNGASLIVLGVVTTYNNTGLTNGLTYTYTVAAITGVGEGPQSASASATPAAAGDINAPIISNVQIGTITGSGATVTLNTNEPATVVARHSTDPALANPSYTSPTASGLDHSVSISGYPAGNRVYFRLIATDTPGNVGVDASIRSFTTTPLPAPNPPPSGTLIPVGGFVNAMATAVAGQHFVIDPGTHNVPSGTIPRLVVPNVWITAVSPTPLIKPAARPDGLYVEQSGTHLDGLAFGGNAGTYNDGQGSAFLEILGRDRRIYDTTLENLAFDAPVGAAKVQHCLYLNGDIERLTATNITSHGHGSSMPGLHAYHAPTGGPCRDIVIDGWVFTDHLDAILFWLSTANLTIRNCDFVGSRQLDIRLWLYGGTATITNCRGSKGIRVDGPTTVIESGNDWSWP